MKQPSAASTEYVYEFTSSWPRLPEGMELGDVASVGVDSRDRVYVFHRGPDPIIVFNRDGDFITTWGHGDFLQPHGLSMGPDDSIYLTDIQRHTVRKFTLDGKVLMEIGLPGKPSPFLSGQPLNRCTHTAIGPGGEIFVADGYGNGCVHKYSPDGVLLRSWGRTGSGPGEFNIVHNVVCDSNGWLYVADRENHRIQVFDNDGRFETQWHGLHRPLALFMPKASNICYVGELGPQGSYNRGLTNLGPRISILNTDGVLLARIGADRAGVGEGQFMGPHGITVDSRGDIYVGEVANVLWPVLFDAPKPQRIPTLRKLRRVN